MDAKGRSRGEWMNGAQARAGNVRNSDHLVSVIDADHHVTSSNFAPRQPTFSIASLIFSDTIRAMDQPPIRKKWQSTGICDTSIFNLVTVRYWPARSARWSF